MIFFTVIRGGEGYSKAGRTYEAIPTSNSLHKHQQAVSRMGSSEILAMDYT